MASTGSITDGSQRREILVISMTSGAPYITRMADGLKVDSVLEAGRATVRVELVKVDDCQAQFTCQVRGLDSQGREAVSTTSLLQQPSQRGNLGYDGSLMPAMSLQLLTSIQQLVTQSVAGLGDKMEAIEHRLENKMDSLEHRLEDKLDTIERRLRGEIEDRTESVKSSIEDELNQIHRDVSDKFRFLENRLEDKIDRRHNHNKLTQQTAKEPVKLADCQINLKEEILGSLDALKRGQQESLVDFSNIVERNLSKISDFAADMESHLDQLKSYRDPDVLALINETEAVREMLTSREILSTRSWNEIFGRNKSIKLMNVDDFESVSHNFTAETLSGFRELLSKSDFSKVGDLKDMLAETFSPSTCKRGTKEALAYYPFPHVLINPIHKLGDILNLPYLCDTATDGGGWVVIQRRTTGDVDFNRDWKDYKLGFGSFGNDFWLGNDHIHAITNSGDRFEIRIDLKYKGKNRFAHYDMFSIADEDDNYRLQLGAYNGTAGDSFTTHNGRPFTTVDRDNDAHSSSNCATTEGGGWWFASCDTANLNGNWGAGRDRGLEWNDLSGFDSSVSFTEMKIRLV